MNSTARFYLLAAVCLTAFGCASPTFDRKLPLERDIQQCTYGVVVPDNIAPRDREQYIHEVAVPACLRAKGYADAEGAR